MKSYLTETAPLSTFDECMQNPQRRKKFEQKYQELVLVEILIPILEKSEIPVRVLAKTAGVSPTTIQEIKFGKKEGISYTTFLALLKALGYTASLRISKQRRRKNPPPTRKRRATSPRRRALR